MTFVRQNLTMAIKMIFGLGNPEPVFKNTRHNAGYMFVDEYHKHTRQRNYFKDPLVPIAIKPDVYINHSGVIVKKFMKNFGITDPKEILIVLDCLAIPLGELRYRSSGSYGGHNGMKSIIEQLGTEDIPRIRMGVGAVHENMTISDFVCGRFFDDEIEVVNTMNQKICNWFFPLNDSGRKLMTDKQETNLLNKELENG